MSLGDEKYMLFTSFRRNGAPVSTVVWLVPLAPNQFGFWTSSGSGKVKRLAHTPRVTVQAATGAGKPKAGAPVLNGSARVVSGQELEQIRAKVIAKYGFLTKLTRLIATTVWRLQGKDWQYGDTGVIVTLDPDT